MRPIATGISRWHTSGICAKWFPFAAQNFQGVENMSEALKKRWDGSATIIQFKNLWCHILLTPLKGGGFLFERPG